MSLSSSSTVEEIQAVYDDNLDYDLDASATKCKAFIQAARMLMGRLAAEVEQGDTRVQNDYHRIQEELAKAEGWWHTNDSSASSRKRSGLVRHLSFGDFRS